MDQSFELPEGYIPSVDEPFMNPRQIEFFKQKLLKWKFEIQNDMRSAVVELQQLGSPLSDFGDQANAESDRRLMLRTRDRQRKLVAKIDSALHRINSGEFGYCEDTGRPISLRRLIARPIATLCLEAQEKHERNEKVFRED